MYAKDLSESKYEYLIKNLENAGIKHLNDSKAFIECWNTMDDIYKNINNYNANRKRKILIFWWYDCTHYDKQKISIINQRIVYKM